MTSAILKSLTVAPREERNVQDPFIRTKMKLISNLRQQLKAAEGMVKGEPYTVPRTITVEEDGQKVRKQINKPIKTWYWRDSEGHVRFAIRIANKAVDIEKGKTDIVVGDDKHLPTVVATILKAAEAGELDKLVKEALSKKKSAS